VWIYTAHRANVSEGTEPRSQEPSTVSGVLTLKKKKDSAFLRSEQPGSLVLAGTDLTPIKDVEGQGMDLGEETYTSGGGEKGGIHLGSSML